MRYSRYAYDRGEDYDSLRNFTPEEMPLAYPLVENVHTFCSNIPMRLTFDERSVMRLIRGVLAASRYTDRVDTPLSSHNPQVTDPAVAAKHRALQCRELYSICLALLSGIHGKHTTALLQDPKRLSELSAELMRVFEYIRRYKILNPDLLRTDYGKVLHMLQDSVQLPIRAELGFSLVGEIVTVGTFCREKNLESLLEDPLLPLCTTPVPAHSDRDLLNRALRFKSAAVKRLVTKYRSKCGVGSEDIESVVYSISDANQYTHDNAGAVRRFLDTVKQHFRPEKPHAPEFDLGITEGVYGSRLTHSHTEQFFFVQQTLTFWANILERMFPLWVLAESEFLDGAIPYSFQDTGQGYQRVQRNAQATRKAIEDIMDATRREVGQWVGSSRIHLGDPQVPNGFAFLDKYAQITRILSPILTVLAHIDTMHSGKQATRQGQEFIERTWRSPDRLKKVILTDFLRFGFDGSGGDNMEDAGSCVDGRLTSAWNWCNVLHEKPFYPFFVLAGVNSFDGDLHT